MFRLPQHVEDELQAFLELLCPSAIVLESHMPKESIEISNILVKEEIIELPNKGKEKPKELQSKRKHSAIDCERRDIRAIQDRKSPR